MYGKLQLYESNAYSGADGFRGPKVYGGPPCLGGPGAALRLPLPALRARYLRLLVQAAAVAAARTN